MVTNKELDDKIPEGMEVVGAKLVCDKHGDVTQAVLRIPYSVKKPEDEKATLFEHYFCIQCLAELFDKLQEEGKIGQLTLQRQVASHETAEKLRQEILQKQQEELAKAEGTKDGEQSTSEI